MSHQDQYGNPVRPSGTAVPLTGSGYGESQQQMNQGPDECQQQMNQGPTTAEKIKEKIPGVGQKEHQGPTTAEKIKEKISGIGRKENQGPTSATTTTPAAQHQEKKGMIEKIKEKLPGQH